METLFEDANGDVIGIAPGEEGTILYIKCYGWQYDEAMIELSTEDLLSLAEKLAAIVRRRMEAAEFS